MAQKTQTKESFSSDHKTKMLEALVSSINAYHMKSDYSCQINAEET